MLRSLIAIIIAVLVGMTLSKFIEAIGQEMLGAQYDILSGAAPSATYQFSLILGWTVGAFFAAVTALLIGRRWAPLGGLAAGTIFFSAIIAQLSFSLSWLLTPFAAIATALAGYAAIRLLKATNQYPSTDKTSNIFHD